nr:hypothetical protein [Tanacetum cinerariifolium]
MSWFLRYSWCGGPFNGGNCRRCTNVSFGDEFVHNPDPISNDETLDFSYPPSQPQTSSFDQFYCYGCRDSLEVGVRCQQCTCIRCRSCLRKGICFICASSNENSSINDPNPNSFIDTPNIFTHPPKTQYKTYSCELCGNDSHHGYDCPLWFSLVYKQERSYNQNISHNYYTQNSPSFTQQYLCCDNCGGPHECFQSMQSMVEMSRQQEQAANLNTHTSEPSRCFNSIFYDDDDDDDDEERTPLYMILFLNILRLFTIPEKELDEFIKFSVEDLVPILSKSEDTSGSDSECILPSCDDFSSINIFEEKSVTFSNLFFNSNDDFTSSDDESLSDEDVLEDNVKIYSNPLFKFDDEYISSDVNPLFEEVLEDIECKDSYVSNLDESTSLVTPLYNSNEDEYFAPGDDVELLLHRDPSTLMMSIASILEGFTDEPPLEENDDLFDLESKENKWKKILYNALIDDLLTEDKVFDPRIPEKFFSLTYVSLPFMDRHYLFFTYVVRILLFYFTYPVVSPFLLSSGSEDAIFDPSIFAFHFSHRSGTFISFNVYPNILNESVMEICSSTHFEDSRARGSVFRSLELQSLAYGNPIF